MIQKRTFSLLVLIPLCTAFALPVTADEAADARKAIQDAYTRVNAAAARKDIASMLAYMTPDFVQTDAKGKQMNKAQLKQMLVSLFASTVSLQDTTTVQKLTLSGREATVRVIDQGRFVVRDPKTGKTIKVTGSDVAEEIWIKEGNKWLERRSRTLSQKVTANGKPVSN